MEGEAVDADTIRDFGHTISAGQDDLYEDLIYEDLEAKPSDQLQEDTYVSDEHDREESFRSPSQLERQKSNSNNTSKVNRCLIFHKVIDIVR